MQYKQYVKLNRKVPIRIYSLMQELVFFDSFYKSIPPACLKLTNQNLYQFFLRNGDDLSWANDVVDHYVSLGHANIYEETSLTND